MSAAKSASTPEKSRGTKAVETALSDDEAASEEVAVTDPEVDNVSVAMVPERVPSTEGGVAPELPATTPPAAAQTVTDQAMLGLPAEVAGLDEKTTPTAVPATPGIGRLSPKRNVCDVRHAQPEMQRKLSL
nr:uncharacterized protein LOC117850086 isoform X2 [Setaria viridis]